MSTPAPTDPRADLLADLAFRNRFTSLYRGRHDPEQVLEWWAKGDPTAPKDASRLTELRSAAFSRPDPRVDAVAVGAKLADLEQLLAQDRLHAEQAFTSAAQPPNPGHTTAADHARSAEDRPQPPTSSNVRPRRRRILLLLVGVTAIVLAAGWATATALNPHRDPLAVFDGPAVTLDAFPHLSDRGETISDIHSLGTVNEWDFYAARGDAADVCLVLTRGQNALGPSCVTELEFRHRGVAISYALDADTYLPQGIAMTTFVFIWDEQGNISVLH